MKFRSTASEFKPLEVGEHIFEIFEVEVKEEFKRLTINTTVDGTKQRFRIFFNFEKKDGSENNVAYIGISNIGRACFNNEEREFEPEELIGKKFIGTVSLNEYNGNSSVQFDFFKPIRPVTDDEFTATPVIEEDDLDALLG